MNDAPIPTRARRLDRRARSCGRQCFLGQRLGAAGRRVGEVCFNTSDDRLSGDPDRPLLCRADHHLHLPPYRQCRGQSRGHRDRRRRGARRSCCARTSPQPSNWRARQPLDAWLKSNDIAGICGIDTRALTRRIRDGGAPNGALCHAPDGKLDIAALRDMARAWPGLEGMDLAKEVTCRQSYSLGRDGVALGRRLWPPRAAALQGGRGRLRRQAQHPAHARRARRAT